MYDTYIRKVWRPISRVNARVLANERSAEDSKSFPDRGSTFFVSLNVF